MDGRSCFSAWIAQEQREGRMMNYHWTPEAAANWLASVLNGETEAVEDTSDKDRSEGSHFMTVGKEIIPAQDAYRLRIAGQVLDKALKRVESGWTQGASARNLRGDHIGYLSPDAVTFSAYGAIVREIENDDECTMMCGALVKKIFCVANGIKKDRIQSWNDANWRGASQVIHAFRNALKCATNVKVLAPKKIDLPYRYEASGLSDVFLLNGVTPAENADGVCIKDINALHGTMCQAILRSTRTLRGDEIKFIRSELGMTPEKFGHLIGRPISHVLELESGEEKISRHEEYIVRFHALADPDIVHWAKPTNWIQTGHRPHKDGFYNFQWRIHDR